MPMLDWNETLMRNAKLSARLKTTSKSKASASTKIKSKPRSKLSSPLDFVSSSSSSPLTRKKAPRHSALFASSSSPTKTQRYLDFGQKSLGKSITCSRCGLFYVAGETEDEKEHARFCKKRQMGVLIFNWKHERVVKRFAAPINARVLEIRGDDPPHHVQKLLEIKRLLDDALGFVEKDLFLARRHFCYLVENRVVGCLSAEQIDKATRWQEQYPCASSPIQCEDQRKEATTQESLQREALVGVCQIYVHPNFRHRRIASCLVDVLRERFFYGMSIHKNQVAFAQPTVDGIQFAREYSAPCEVLVYGNTL